MTAYPTAACTKGGPVARRAGGQQAGQAVVEAGIVLSMLLLLWFAISWVAGLQDIGLAAQHAGRHAAFMHSRGAPGDMRFAVRKHYFYGPAHQWSSIDGGTLFDTVADEPQLHIDSGVALPDYAQPGGEASHAASLRHGWALQDSGITTAQVSVATRASRHLSAVSSVDAPDDVMGASWTLRRHTSVLTNGGHAQNDTAVQERVAASGPGWTNSAQASYGLAQRITDRMGAVDAGWTRPLPLMDWLGAWEGAVPDSHLVPADGGPHDD